MNSRLHRRAATPLLVLGFILSLGLSRAWALDDEVSPGRQAAALASQAATLEADIDKTCLKVAREARPLCQRQQAQAVQRLRMRAERTR